MADRCDHYWNWQCPPIGPDWAECTKCAEVILECEFCNARYPWPKRKCPSCHKFRTGRGLFKVLT